LRSIEFKGKKQFKLNSAYPFEAEVFHDMCNHYVTPERINDLVWANARYKKGDEAVFPRNDPYTIENIIDDFLNTVKRVFNPKEI